MDHRRKRASSESQHHFLWASSLRGMERPVHSSRSLSHDSPVHLIPNKNKPLPPLPKMHGDLPGCNTSWKVPVEWASLYPSKPSLQISPLASTLASTQSHASLPSDLDQQVMERPCLQPSSNRGMQSALLSRPTKTMLRMSQLNMKSKTLTSLGIELPKDQQSESELWSSRLDSVQAKNASCPNLSIRSRDFRPLRQRSLERGMQSDDDDQDERLQQLSVSQEYHSILAEQYHGTHPYTLKDIRESIRNEEQVRHNNAYNAETASPLNDHELVPRPLYWTKEQDGFLISRSTTDLSVDQSSTLRSGTMHHKSMPWRSIHQYSNSCNGPNLDDGDTSCRTSAPAAPRCREIPESEVDRLLKDRAHLPDLIPYVKAFKHKLERLKATSNRAQRANATQEVLPPTSRTANKPRYEALERHLKEVKRDEFKRSIRVVGLKDLTVSAGFI